MNSLCLTLFFTLLWPCANCPPPQETWSEGAFGGTKVMLWLYSDPARPDLRDLTECRLAGVADVRDPADSASRKHQAILEQLYGGATVSLSYLIASERLHAYPIKREQYEKCQPSTDPRFAPTRCETKSRLVVVLTILSDTRKPVDVAVPLLRAGRIYLSRLWLFDLSEKEGRPYREAQVEAQANSAGVWYYDPEIWRESQVEARQIRPRPIWPSRKP